MSFKYKALNVIENIIIASGIVIAVFFFSAIISFFSLLVPSEESIRTAEKLKAIDDGMVAYARDIIEEEWDWICSLPPYHESLPPPFDETLKSLNDKITSTHLWTGDGLSYLILADDFDNFRALRLSLQNGIMPKQSEFKENALKIFSDIGFTPSGCVQAKYAVFIKYTIKYAPDYISHAVVLGELSE